MEEDVPNDGIVIDEKERQESSKQNRLPIPRDGGDDIPKRFLAHHQVQQLQKQAFGKDENLRACDYPVSISAD